MAIMRIKKQTGNFVIINNKVLRDKSLSLKAKGLLAYLLSFPPDWNVCIKEVIKDHKEGKDAIYSAINELREAGYIYRYAERDEKGGFTAYVYQVFEEPQIEEELQIQPLPENPEMVATVAPYPENPRPENPYTVKSDPGNQKYINNKINNKHKTNSNQQVQPLQPKQPHPNAAVASLSLQDCLISNTLSAVQCQHIKQCTQSVIHPHYPDVLLNDCVKAVKLTMLNPKNFTDAGKDFSRKLNTITKAAQKKTWSPLQILALHESHKEQTKLSQHEEKHKKTHLKLEELTLTRRSLIESLNRPIAKTEGYTKSIHSEINHLTEEINSLQASLSIEKQQAKGATHVKDQS